MIKALLLSMSFLAGGQLAFHSASVPLTDPPKKDGGTEPPKKGGEDTTPKKDKEAPTPPKKTPPGGSEKK